MKTLLRIWVKDGRVFREIDNGPFPITENQLIEARRQFADESRKAGHLEGANIAPQTTARDILKDIAPQLGDFDRLMLGFAVTNECVEFERVVNEVVLPPPVKGWVSAV